MQSKPQRHSSRAGFTLLELCLAVAIALLVLGIAVPSVRGIFAEQRLRDRMGQFEVFVQRAARLARDTRHEVRLCWERGGVRMVPDMETTDDSLAAAGMQSGGGEWFALEDGEGLTLLRTAQRDTKADPQWCFWPAGVREPVEVSYTGPLGSWVLRFSPLIPDPEIVKIQGP